MVRSCKMWRVGQPWVCPKSVVQREWQCSGIQDVHGTEWLDKIGWYERNMHFKDGLKMIGLSESKGRTRDSILYQQDQIYPIFLTELSQ
jgi:hypothetical protein